MISDVLAEACQQIQSYLDDPVFDKIYPRELRSQIERVAAEMDALRATLDRLPPQAEQQQNSG
jgi:hypothetical protein